MAGYGELLGFIILFSLFLVACVAFGIGLFGRKYLLNQWRRENGFRYVKPMKSDLFEFETFDVHADLIHFSRGKFRGYEFSLFTFIEDDWLKKPRKSMHCIVVQLETDKFHLKKRNTIGTRSEYVLVNSSKVNHNFKFEIITHNASALKVRGIESNGKQVLFYSRFGPKIHKYTDQLEKICELLPLITSRTS